MRAIMLSGTRYASWLLLCALFCTGCGSVRFVADYDQAALDDLAESSAQVFAFYDKLLETRAATGVVRYAPYAEDWGKVETRLRVGILREQARPKNQESVEILATTLDMWIRFRDSHRSRDDYVPAKIAIDRKHMARNLGAAMNAEEAKKLGKAAATAPEA